MKLNELANGRIRKESGKCSHWGLVESTEYNVQIYGYSPAISLALIVQGRSLEKMLGLAVVFPQHARIQFCCALYAVISRARELLFN